MWWYKILPRFGLGNIWWSWACVSVFFVSCSYASYDCHQTMWHIHAQSKSYLWWYDGWAGCVTWFHVYHEPLFGEMISYATSSRSNERKYIWGKTLRQNTSSILFVEMTNSDISDHVNFFLQDRALPHCSRCRPPPQGHFCHPPQFAGHIERWGIEDSAFRTACSYIT